MKKIIVLCLGIFFLIGCSKASDSVSPVPKMVQITSISPSTTIYSYLNPNTQYDIYAKVVTLDGKETGDSINWSNVDGYCEFYNPASNSWGSTGTSASGSYIKIRCTATARTTTLNTGYCTFLLYTNIGGSIFNFAWYKYS